jgi:glycosyltransferase involved in cell wall biosynthesis
MSDSISVSFVVIAYNEASNIKRMLQSVMDLDMPSNHEVIVVDDGSRDGTSAVVRQVAAADARVRLITLPENRGRGYARKTGVSAAEGELIAIVDADVVLPQDWFVRSYSELEGHSAVGGISVPDGDVAYIYQRTHLVPRPVAHPIAVSGSNGLYRSEVFALQNFDPRLREGEDTQLNYILTRQGASFRSVPGLIVTHLEDKPLGASLRWLFQMGIGATRQLVSHRDVRLPDLTAAGFILTAAIGAIVVVRGAALYGVLIPAIYIALASTLHIRSKFRTPVRQLPQVLAAIGVDCAMLTAYFVGRLVGLPVLLFAGRSRSTIAAG